MLRIRGFTLIEIIIVIGILSITVGFVAPFSISQISENRVYESAAEFSSVLFLNQQYANSMKDGKAYAVEINNDGYSTISSLSEDLGSDGLLGYWKLNEKQWDGTVDEIVDSSGNDYNGKTVNGPIISKDGFTSSPYFDGNNDYIELDILDANINGTGAMSISVWFKATTDGLVGGQNNLRYIVSKEAGGPGGTVFILRVSTTDDKVQFYLGGTTYVGITSDTTITANNWYHAVATWDGSGMNLYINGGSPDTGSKSGATGSTTNKTRIGSVDLGSPNDNISNWQGNIDELRVYNFALSGEDVEKLHKYNQRKFDTRAYEFTDSISLDLVTNNNVVVFDEGGFRPFESVSFFLNDGPSSASVEINQEGLINYYIEN